MMDGMSKSRGQLPHSISLRPNLLRPSRQLSHGRLFTADAVGCPVGQSYLKLAHKTQSQDKWLANAILFVTEHAAHTARRAASGCDIRNPDITLDPVVAANTTARSCARRYESRSSAVMAATETKFAVNSRVNAVMTFSLIDLPEGTSRTILFTPLVQTASPAPFCDDGRDCARLPNIPELLGQIMESVHTALWCAGCNNCTGISHHCSR
jgi:hypothetical protein